MIILFWIYTVTSLLQLWAFDTSSNLIVEQKVSDKMSMSFIDFYNPDIEVSFVDNGMIAIKDPNGMFSRFAIIEALTLEYDTPLDLQQDYAAYCDPTHQVESVLSVQNLSKNYDATFFISPQVDANNSGVYNIPSNSSKSVRIVNNWDGSTLKVANISSQKATIKVTLF